MPKLPRIAISKETFDSLQDTNHDNLNILLNFIKETFKDQDSQKIIGHLEIVLDEYDCLHCYFISQNPIDYGQYTRLVDDVGDYMF